MAPILAADLHQVPALVVAAAGFLIAVITLLLCADGGDSKKAKPMKKVTGFSDIASPGGNGATKGKLALNATVPLQGPSQSNNNKNSKPIEKLGVDAMQILRKAFNDDKSLSRLTIDEKRLNVTDIIGQGNFGLVYKGTLMDRNMQNPKEVAVKTIHGTSCTKSDVEMFIRESARMKGFAHQHVMAISGITNKENKPYIILPFMANGDLRAYISNQSRKFTLEDLTNFGYQVAQGMSYLSMKKFIHRDLAARNCMVSHDNIVKIADFGLSRDLYQADYYKMSDLATPLPIRWVALESVLTSKFTTKSDVWSFGILLWELVTRGRNPYPDIKDNLAVITFLRDGKRLETPAYVTDSLKKVMRKCWEAKPDDRPDFGKLCTMLHYILEDENDYMSPKKR